MKPRLRPLAAVAVLSLVPAAWGAEPAGAPCAGRSQASCDAPGLVEAPHITRKGSLPASEGRQVGQRVAKLLEVVRQAPRLREPRGMSLHSSISVEAPPAHAAKQHPAITRASLRALPIKVEDPRAVRDKKTGAWRGTGEGPALRFIFNDLGSFLSGEPLDFSNPAQFFTAPRQVGEVQGFPVYDVDGREVLLVRKGEALPWRPFPVERYLQHLLSQEEATLALLEKQLPAQGPARAQLEKVNAGRRERIAALKQELSRLTPAQRQAGACLAARRPRGDLTGLELACGAGAMPLVEANPAFFARSAPRSSLQLLAISSTWGVLQKEDRMPNALGRVLRAALLEVDLAAVRELLDAPL